MRENVTCEGVLFTCRNQNHLNRQKMSESIPTQDQTNLPSSFQQSGPLSASWGSWRPDPEMPQGRLPDGTTTRLRTVLAGLATEVHSKIFH